MLRKWHINRLSMVVAIIFTIFLSCYAAQDATAFDAVPLEDLEMEEISGGFNGGNFLYFGMEVLNMGYYANNNPSGSALPNEFTTNYNQLNSGDVSGLINSNVSGNIGFTNVGVILGDNNTQTLQQFVNISLANFQVTSTDQIKPILSHWTHLTF